MSMRPVPYVWWKVGNDSPQANANRACSRRRKAIYEELHPETRADSFKGNRHTGSLASDNLSFAESTADATGKDRRSVERAAARGEALGEDLHSVAGTSLDKGVELDALALAAGFELATYGFEDRCSIHLS
jgi:hypothetical protein